jgi:hypothetical protein
MVIIDLNDDDNDDDIAADDDDNGAKYRSDMTEALRI